MNKWLMLGIAIVAETIATSALKSSEGFSKLVPSVVVLVGYGMALIVAGVVIMNVFSSAGAH